jgi:hypothetical protein
MVHVEILGDRPATVPVGQPLPCLLLLMIAQLWSAAHVHAAGSSRLAAVVRAFDDAMAFILGHGQTSDGREIGHVTEVVSEPGHESTLIAEIERPGGIGPRTVSIPDVCAASHQDRAFPHF